jgi:hypothetical protein
MNKRAYIIVFDKEENDITQIHSAIETLHNQGQIFNWWHYIKSCYILISNHSADSLAKSIGNIIVSSKKFLVLEINMNNRQGWLKEEEWKWLNDNKIDSSTSF